MKPPAGGKEMEGYMAEKKAYVPGRNWEEKLTTLAQLYGENKWKFGGLDGDVLKKLIAEQQQEQGDDQKLERDYTSFHTGFLGRQASRFGQFMKALEFARSEARDNPALAKKLEQIKRDAQSRKPAPKSA